MSYINFSQKSNGSKLIGHVSLITYSALNTGVTLKRGSLGVVQSLKTVGLPLDSLGTVSCFYYLVTP